MSKEVWRDKKITPKQAIMILKMEKMGCSEFIGKTRGDACDYIKAHMDEYKFNTHDGPIEIDRWQADGGYF